MSNWTPEHRKLWQATWNEPHMQAGLEELKRRCTPMPVPLMEPGFDMQVMSALAHSASVGRFDVLKYIVEMGGEAFVPRPLPNPFTAAARGEQEPTQEQP